MALVTAACSLPRGPASAPPTAPAPRPVEVQPTWTEASASTASLAIPRPASIEAETPEPAPPQRAPFDRQLLFAAGPLPPPGLSSAREAERQRDRAQALEALRRHGDALGPGRLEEELASLLREAPTLREWEAAALAAGSLRLLGLGREIARGFSAGGARQAIAARALHAMHGVWFDGDAAFEPFAALVDATQSEPHVRALGRQEQIAEQRLSEIWKLDPRLIGASLSHVSPAVRRRAAGALSSAVGGSNVLSSEEAAPMLLSRAAIEQDARALGAQLEALTDVLQGSAPDSPNVLRARGLVAELAVNGAPAILHCVGRALAELPWNGDRDTGGTGPALADAVAGIDALLERASAHTYADADVRIGLIESARGLAQRAGQRGAALGAPGRDLVARILAIVAEPSERASLRVAAATAVGDLGVRDDVDALIDIVRAGGELPLRFALLGSLARLAQGLPPEEPRAAALGALALELLREADADIRRRGLALLAEPAVEQRLERAQVDELITYFALETSHELRSILLGTLKRRGSRAQLAVLLSHDSLEAFVGSGSARAAEFADTAIRLAGGDAELLFGTANVLAAGARKAAASSLLAPPPEAEVAHDVVRLARALEVVARSDRGSARSLPLAAHARIVAWCHHLFAAGATLAVVGSEGEALASRLLEVHLTPARAAVAEGVADLHPAEIDRVHGLVLAERGAPRADVLARIENALALAERDGRAALAFAIRRDRARYLAARGETRVPLEDYRELVRLERSSRRADPEFPRRPTVTIQDLRNALQLTLVAGEPIPATRERATTAHWFARALVAHPSWHDEPPTQRFADVSFLVETGLRSGERAMLELLAREFQGLPAASGAPIPTGAADSAGWRTEDEPERPAVWLGLTDREEWRTALQALARRLADALARPGERPQGRQG